MKYILFLPFALQSILMLVDEFYFHRKRGLAPWERWGHPIDTLSVLFVYAVVLWVPPSSSAVAMIGGAILFSTLLVTKDEWIHSRACGPGENWVHALLFGLHPLHLVCLLPLWALRHYDGPAHHQPDRLFTTLPFGLGETSYGRNQGPLPIGWEGLEVLRGLEIYLEFMALPIILMLVHQVVYWNFESICRITRSLN